MQHAFLCPQFNYTESVEKNFAKKVQWPNIHWVQILCVSLFPLLQVAKQLNLIRRLILKKTDSVQMEKYFLNVIICKACAGGGGYE